MKTDIAEKKGTGEVGSEECQSFEFSSVFSHCWLGDMDGIEPVKNWLQLSPKVLLSSSFLACTTRSV